MFCPKCGSKNPENAKFCRSCGTKLTVDEKQEVVKDETPSPASQPASVQKEVATSEVSKTNDVATSTAAQTEIDKLETPKEQPATEKTAPSKKPAGGGFKEWLAIGKNKRKVAILLCAVAVLFVGVNVYNFFASQVPTSTIEQDLKYKCKDGFISSDFVNESAYSFTDIHVTSNEKLPKPKGAYYDLSDLGNAVNYSIEKKLDVYHVKWNGKAKNDAFETDYSAEAYYVYKDSKFSNWGKIIVTWSSTKPLKGVEKFYLDEGKVSAEPGYCESTSAENFECDFDASNKTCTAKQKYIVDYWWGQDTVDLTQSFTFDESEGWKADGDTEIKNFETSYDALTKISFSACSDFWTGILWGINEDEAKYESVVTFDKDATGIPIMSYDFVFDATQAKMTYQKVYEFKGRAAGKFKHSLEETGFSFDLAGSSDNAKFQGYSWYDTGTTPNKHTMIVSL